jgi:hypothetical protein
VRAFMDSVNDLGVIDATQIGGGDREVGVSELALDEQQRDAFARHLDCVGVAQLVGSEPAAHSSAGSDVMQLRADAGGSPWPSLGGAAQDAEQRADRQRGAQRQPRSELLPCPAVHPNLASLITLTMTQRIAPRDASRSLSRSANPDRAVSGRV